MAGKKVKAPRDVEYLGDVVLDALCLASMEECDKDCEHCLYGATNADKLAKKMSQELKKRKGGFFV